MIAALEKGINPTLTKHGYLPQQVRIGIDTGEHSVIDYVLGEKLQVDILGYGISMAAKLSKLAEPNQTVITHQMFFGMNPSFRKKFTQVDLDPRMWKYVHENFHPAVWRSSF